MNEDDASDNLTKVHIDLPNHWGTGGESMWARALAEDRYEIRNVPFYAYGLNFLDVVLANSDDPDLKPEVRRVVQASGPGGMLFVPVIDSRCGDQLVIH